MDAVLEIAGVTRRFGAVVANDEVDLTVRAGQVVGLLGHNGAGKTTLVQQVVGLLRPHAGTIRVAGLDAVAEPARARRAVALQAQAQAPLDGLTPRDAIEIAARLRGASRADSRAAAESLAATLDIHEWIDRRASPDGGGISGGVRRLVSFAMAAAAPVPLVVLDEPTNDVDAARRRLLWQAVRDLADRGAGVLLISHNVVEVERVVDELAILDRGRVVAAGTPAAVRGAREGELRLELTLQPGGSDPSVADPTEEAPPVPVARRVRVGHRVLLTLAREASAEAAVGWAASLHGAGRIDGYALAPASLEDAYLAATAPESKEHADV